MVVQHFAAEFVRRLFRARGLVTRHDADRFRQGYGGELLDFDAAMAAMADAHHPR
jgi:hypothetical protein